MFSREELNNLDILKNAFKTYSTNQLNNFFQGKESPDLEKHLKKVFEAIQACAKAGMIIPDEWLIHQNNYFAFKIAIGLEINSDVGKVYQKFSQIIDNSEKYQQMIPLEKRNYLIKRLQGQIEKCESMLKNDPQNKNLKDIVDSLRFAHKEFQEKNISQTNEEFDLFKEKMANLQTSIIPTLHKIEVEIRAKQQRLSEIKPVDQLAYEFTLQEWNNQHATQIPIRIWEIVKSGDASELDKVNQYFMKHGEIIHLINSYDERGKTLFHYLAERAAKNPPNLADLETFAEQLVRQGGDPLLPSAKKPQKSAVDIIKESSNRTSLVRIDNAILDFQNNPQTSDHAKAIYANWHTELVGGAVAPHERSLIVENALELLKVKLSTRIRSAVDKLNELQDSDIAKFVNKDTSKVKSILNDLHEIYHLVSSFHGKKTGQDEATEMMELLFPKGTNHKHVFENALIISDLYMKIDGGDAGCFTSIGSATLNNALPLQDKLPLKLPLDDPQNDEHNKSIEIQNKSIEEKNESQQRLINEFYNEGNEKVSQRTDQIKAQAILIRLEECQKAYLGLGKDTHKNDFKKLVQNVEKVLNDGEPNKIERVVAKINEAFLKEQNGGLRGIFRRPSPKDFALKVAWSEDKHHYPRLLAVLLQELNAKGNREANDHMYPEFIWPGKQHQYDSVFPIIKNEKNIQAMNNLNHHYEYLTGHNQTFTERDIDNTKNYNAPILRNKHLIEIAKSILNKAPSEERPAFMTDKFVLGMLEGVRKSVLESGQAPEDKMLENEINKSGSIDDYQLTYLKTMLNLAADLFKIEYKCLNLEEGKKESDIVSPVQNHPT